MSDSEKNIPEGWEVRTSRSTGKFNKRIQFFLSGNRIQKIEQPSL